DFNDNPDNKSVVEHLHATGDRKLVEKGGREPVLLDLLAGKDHQKFFTHYYDRGPKSERFCLFDHIVVSPGLLDNQGWSCDPDSLQPVRNKFTADAEGYPKKFGGEEYKGKRGCSDHLPVTVRLKVQPK